jgi:hypothetical protein
MGRERGVIVPEALLRTNRQPGFRRRVEEGRSGSCLGNGRLPLRRRFGSEAWDETAPRKRPKVRFAEDSPLEGDGFELLVPRHKSWRAVPSRPLYTGTESLLTLRWREVDSNPRSLSGIPPIRAVGTETDVVVGPTVPCGGTDGSDQRLCG